MPERTFALLVSEGMPREGDGKEARYPWPETYNWVKKREKEKARPKDRNEAEERLAAAKAQLAELELEEKKGTLVTREAVTAAWTTVGARMRARLINLPAKAAPFLTAVPTQIEAQTRLEKFVDEVVTEFRDYAAD